MMDSNKMFNGFVSTKSGKTPTKRTCNSWHTRAVHKVSNFPDISKK